MFAISLSLFPDVSLTVSLWCW